MSSISGTFCYRDANALLLQLDPYSEEHCQLKKALSKTSSIVEISLPNVTYKIETFSKEEMLCGGFGSSEHFEIGKEVKLKGLEGRTVIVRGKVKVPYEYIIALAGDFYGIYGEAISLPGGTDDDRTKRFLNAFNTLDQAVPDQVRGIMDQIDGEYELVKHSPTPHHCYSYQMMEKNSAIKKIKSDIDNLLIDNSDHFSKNAEDAYRIGHQLALKEAKEAGRKKDVDGLKRAYALDAFASHFLTDLFAAGHIRNQRGDLETFLIKILGFGEDIAKTLSGLLTGAQHEQDGNAGLRVFTNYLGNREEWRAYGDGRFFSPDNIPNKAKVIATVQTSVDEIYAAYENPDKDVISVVSHLIPHVTELNPPPLYSVEGNELFLNHVSGRTKVSSKYEFITQAVAHAIWHLPQEYIDSVLSIKGIASVIGCSNLIERSAFIEKAIIPMSERITGTIWHVIGVATYHQVKSQFNEQNDLLNEIASTLDATFKNTEKIIEKLNHINIQLAESKWDSIYSEIKGSIADILDAMHLYTKEPSKVSIQDLEKALNRISRVFSKGTAEGKFILLAYQDLLTQNLGLKNPFEIKARVTLWFRQMLTLQVNAFCLNSILKSAHEKQDVLRQDILQFEKNIFDQIEKNEKFIDLNLIYQHEQYIELEMCKEKAREKSQQLLQSYGASSTSNWKISEVELPKVHNSCFSEWNKFSAMGSTNFKKSSPQDVRVDIQGFYDDIEKKVDGAIGYPNLGTSCYMNSVLQVLNAFPDVFPINVAPNDGLLKQLQEIRLSKQVDANMLRQLRKQVFEVTVDGELTLGEHAQHDVHEFLSFVLDKIKWNSGLKMTTCRSGLKNEFSRVQEELVKDILIPIIGSDFQKMVDDNFKPKIMTDKDPLRCTIDGEERSFNSWNEKLEIKEHPSHLIIHLERFKSVNGISTRINQRIDFPKDHQVLIEGKVYEIIVFMNHIGNTIHQGHYTADIRREDNTWVRYNDHLVTESQLKNIDKDAYVVILKQKNEGKI